MAVAMTSLQKLQSNVTDPLPKFLWEIYLPPLPGTNDTSQLKYKAISADMPKTSIEETNWEGKGVKLNFAGRRLYDGTWSITIIESRDNSTRDALMAYFESIRSWKKNSGLLAQDYKVNPELILLDQTNSPIRSIKLMGAWLQDATPPSLDQSSGIQEYQATWRYDWFDEYDPNTNQPIPLGV